MQYELKLPEWLTADKPTGKAKQPKEKADSDPREFYIDLNRDMEKQDVSQPIELTVKYIACDDAETFCKPVTQKYQIFIKLDKNVGWRLKTGPRASATVAPK